MIAKLPELLFKRGKPNESEQVLVDIVAKINEIIDKCNVITKPPDRIVDVNKTISHDDIFCRLLNTYTNYVYADTPHGLSDKDIEVLTQGIMDLFGIRIAEKHELYHCSLCGFIHSDYLDCQKNICPLCKGAKKITDGLSDSPRTCPQCNGTGTSKPSNGEE